MRALQEVRDTGQARAVGCVRIVDLANKSPQSGEKVAIGNGKTTRELLGQSDQNDWRTPRKCTARRAAR
jgi:hypothetical protein